jgi:ribA/ribD-fused uncharacterized protein
VSASIPPIHIIASFTGDYRFLSNFAPSWVVYDGETYSTVEHAFQAAKTTNLEHRAEIRRTETSSAAKDIGRRVNLRPGWNEARLDVMHLLLWQKFSQPSFRAALLATRPHVLIEANTWGDRFWGQSPVGNGENRLGVALMQIRHALAQAPWKEP